MKGKTTFVVLAVSTLLTLIWLLLGARPWSRPSILLDGAFWFMTFLLLSPYGLFAMITRWCSRSNDRSLVAFVGASLISLAGVGFIICETFSHPSLADGFYVLFLSFSQWVAGGIVAMVAAFYRE
jgi:hypothetical protein